MNKNATNRSLKWLIMANLLMAGSFGWSCSTDVRDAIWAGALDYLTTTTTDTLTAVSPIDDLTD